MDEIQDRIQEIKKEQDEQRKNCGELQQAISALVEAQKNTTRNVDTLAADVKGVLKTTMHFELLDKKLELTNARISKIEATSNQCPIINKDISDLQTKVKELENRDYSVVKRRVEETEKDIKDLIESKTWGFRLIVGAVLLGILGLMFDLKLHSMIGG